MNQSFNTQQLIRFIKISDYRDYHFSATELKTQLDNNFIKINNNKFEFNIVKKQKFYLTNDLPNKLILRKLNENIKCLYKDEQANRRIIISQVKTLLEETCDFWILKTDIKKFYESIDRIRIIEKLHEDAILSYYSIYILKKLFSSNLFINFNGLAKVLNISASLSEIYMRRFDRWIRRFDGVYYYARYVDDIIIFARSKDVIKEIRKNINPKLEELAKGLAINEAKTKSFDGNSILNRSPLEYLGYKFIKKDRKSNLSVTIADKKVKKIKTRIMLTILDFIKNRDIILLENRIKFLTGNYSIRKNNEGNVLKAGIYYNYLQVTDIAVFDELNIFYRKALYSKNKKFGQRLSQALSKQEREKLNKYSFKSGYENKVYNSFSADQMSKIISCW